MYTSFVVKKRRRKKKGGGVEERKRILISQKEEVRCVWCSNGMIVMCTDSRSLLALWPTDELDPVWVSACQLSHLLGQTQRLYHCKCNESQACACAVFEIIMEHVGSVQFEVQVCAVWSEGLCSLKCKLNLLLCLSWQRFLAKTRSQCVVKKIMCIFFYMSKPKHLRFLWW